MMKEKQKIEKSPRNHVVQRYKVIGGTKVSNDKSLQLSERAGKTHRFWAKKGLFDKQIGRLQKSQIKFYKEREEEKFDLITAEYGGKCADEMIAPSDCGEFTKLILGRGDPYAAFFLDKDAKATERNLDPDVYKKEIIKALAGAIDAMTFPLCCEIYRESRSFVNLFIAPELDPERIWSVPGFQERVMSNISQIVAESKLLFFEIMDEEPIREYVLEECQDKDGVLRTNSRYRMYKSEILGIDRANYKEKLWEMKSVICFLMEIKKPQVMAKLKAFSADMLRRVCTQSITLLGFIKKWGWGCLASQEEQKQIPLELFKDAVKSMSQEQLERLISESRTLAEYLYVNQYTVPGVGGAYVISSGGNDISGENGRMWPHHWAGVVMVSEDGKDQVVMENYYYDGKHNDLWQFDMVGLRIGQTFHDIHKSGRLHGDAPVTMTAVGH